MKYTRKILVVPEKDVGNFKHRRKMQEDDAPRMVHFSTAHCITRFSWNQILLTSDSTFIVAQITREWFLATVHAQVAGEIRMDLELGLTDVALEGCIASVGTQVDSQLGGVLRLVCAHLTPDIKKEIFFMKVFKKLKRVQLW